MSLTYGDIRKSTLKILDEYSTSGNISTTNDVLIKIRDLVNQAMVDLASSTAKIHGEFYIEQAPIYNYLSQDTSSIKTHLPGTDFSITLEGAKSAFFEVTGPATVVIEESDDNGSTYSTIETITVASTTTDFQEYKRLISPSADDNIVRLRFTGDYVYKYRNYILYPYTWPTADDVQQHRSHFIYDLPSDFLKLELVMTRKDTRQYVPYENYILRSDRKIGINRFDSPAEYLIHYWKYPTLFTFTDIEATDDAQSFGIDAANGIYRVADDAALITPFYVAGHVLLSEGELSKSITLINMYEQKKVNLVGNDIGYVNSVINITGW